MSLRRPGYMPVGRFRAWLMRRLIGRKENWINVIGNGGTANYSDCECFASYRSPYRDGPRVTFIPCKRHTPQVFRHASRSTYHPRRDKFARLAVFVLLAIAAYALWVAIAPASAG